MQPTRRRVVRFTLILGMVLVTIGQILRPGLNQDVRFVLGALGSAGAAGLGWTEVWAHRPLVARGVIALLAAVSPGEFWIQEVAIRAWCVALALGAAVALWRGLLGWCTPRVAGWTALGAGIALAWAPGWDFAEPEWFAAVLAVAGVGCALWSGRGEASLVPVLLSGPLLGLVVLLKFTTAATALVALLAIAFVDQRRASRAAISAVLSASALFALTILIAPQEWQWLVDMPTLNPGFSVGGLPMLVEGLVNSAIVSPVTLVALVALAWLGVRGERRAALMGLAGLALLVVPFAVQQQNFLYHLAALPVAAAALVGAVAGHAVRLPVALPATGTLGLLVGVGLFAIGPRTRAANWWVGAVAVAAVLVVGLGLLAIRRGLAGPDPLVFVLIALSLVAPLLVTVSPRTAYSFSLAHNRTTASTNGDQALAAAERRAEVRTVLPPDEQVIYLSFAAPYWIGNPTPCRYVSPTFLQRSTGAGGEQIAATRSFEDNLACLGDPTVQAVVIEPGWFNLDRARPEVREALAEGFNCTRGVEIAEWLICPSR